MTVDDDNTAQSRPASPGSGPVTAAPNERDDAWASPRTVPSAAGASPAAEHPAQLAAEPAQLAAKGKEKEKEKVKMKEKDMDKAARGPLRLLDLPVDILKEIIHQVCAPSVAMCRHRAPRLTWPPTAATHKRPDVPLALPHRPAPPHHPVHLLALRHRLA